MCKLFLPPMYNPSFTQKRDGQTLFLKVLTALENITDCSFAIASYCCILLLICHCILLLYFIAHLPLHLTVVFSLVLPQSQNAASRFKHFLCFHFNPVNLAICNTQLFLAFSIVHLSLVRF